MLRKGLQTIGLLLLCAFSFFYTERVVTVVKNKDPLMIKINEFEMFYNIEPVNAVVNQNEIIPGVNGCIVDSNKSYSNMKRIGNYNSNMIEYKEIKPELSLSKVYDKYIISGNATNNNLSIVFMTSSGNYLEEVLVVLKEKQIKASFFLDGKLIEEKTNLAYRIINDGHEIYNLGYNNRYEKDLLIWTNNIIESIARNKSNYCLVVEENERVLDLCAQNKMHTIKANVIVNYSNTFSAIRSNIEKGSIIMFDINSVTQTELIGSINFLTKKGYIFKTLSEHLTEKGCE